MIGQRQIEFRREYRSRILGWYDGYFHIAIIYAIGLLGDSPTEEEEDEVGFAHSRLEYIHRLQ